MLRQAKLSQQPAMPLLMRLPAAAHAVAVAVGVAVLVMVRGGWQ